VKKIVLGLFALPILALAAGSADANWSICGQNSCTYSFHSPRVWFGFDCCPAGCPAPYARPGVPAAAPVGVPAAPGAAATPWFNQFPPPHAQAPVAVPAPAPVAAPTAVPVSYSTGARQAQPTASSYQVPSYWYGR
jgi:hypothetical protein